MQEPDILDAAFQLLDQFRGNAELRAGEETNRALERGDSASFDRWGLIAQTIIAARGRRYPVIQLEEQPADAPLSARLGGSKLATA